MGRAIPRSARDVAIKSFSFSRLLFRTPIAGGVDVSLRGRQAVAISEVWEDSFSPRNDSPQLVIARSEATWQSPKLCEVTSPGFQLGRNDRLWPTVIEP